MWQLFLNESQNQKSQIVHAGNFRRCDEQGKFEILQSRLSSDNTEYFTIFNFFCCPISVVRLTSLEYPNHRQAICRFALGSLMAFASGNSSVNIDI